eukprot:1180309-Prorocentrum_minimum.AAC.1
MLGPLGGIQDGRGGRKRFGARIRTRHLGLRRSRSGTVKIAETCTVSQMGFRTCETEYTRSGHQSRKGRENIPVAGTNHGRGENKDVRIEPNLGVWLRS